MWDEAPKSRIKGVLFNCRTGVCEAEYAMGDILSWEALSGRLYLPQSTDTVGMPSIAT
jgi:hypothetical protein